MNIDIDDKLSKIETLPFDYERTTLTENMFHISIWNKMNTHQKVKLLQLLEDNLAYVQGRKSSKVVLKSKLPHMATSSYITNSIRVSQWYLENGLPYLKDMNAQMYCAIVHEHEHINQFLVSGSNQHDSKTEEIRSNIANFIPYRDASISDYVDYRFQPIEYYAHKISEENTKATFERLEAEFGIDNGFVDWYKFASAASVDNLVKLYNEENSTNLSFDEIYKGILEKITKRENKSKK